ncbi:ProP effector [Pararobbsia alpina]|uniref:ProQ/FinO family protein n=1 Tax=Pararobbsia alpina TaxID=621374 RepID=UPI0039A58292
MGFEQLAALRTELAEKARQEKLAKQGGGGGKGRGPRPPKGAVAKTEGKPGGDAQAAGSKPAKSNNANSANHAPRASNGPKSSQTPNGRPRHEGNEGARTHGGKRGDRGDRQARPARASHESATPTDPVLLLIRKLQNRFSATFPKKPAPKVPLKIGIFEDLMAHATELGADEAQLRAAIKTWCGGSRYWACMVEGAQRIDLAGQPAGVVTAADANRARRLETHREKRAQQRAAGDAGAKQDAGHAQASSTAPTPDTSASASTPVVPTAAVGSDTAPASTPQTQSAADTAPAADPTPSGAAQADDHASNSQTESVANGH